GIKEGCVLVVTGGPPEFMAATLGTLPAGVDVRTDGRSPAADVVIYFVTSEAKLRERISALRGRIRQDGAVWVAWPKKASGVKTDMNEDTIRACALPIGLVDNKVGAIGAVWSGLRR